MPSNDTRDTRTDRNSEVDVRVGFTDTEAAWRSHKPILEKCTKKNIKGVEGSERAWKIIRHCSVICLEELRKLTKTLIGIAGHMAQI